MADWVPTVITGVSALFSGAFGKAVWDSVIHGRAQRRAALGEHESRLDRALASRAVWFNDALWHRGVVYRRAPDEQRDMPIDPWTCPTPPKET